MNRRRIIRIVLGLAALVGLGFAFKGMVPMFFKKPEAAKEALRVGVMTVSSTRDAFKVAFTGTAAAAREVNVYPPSTGKVAKLLVTKGRSVKAGQALAVLDNPQVVSAKATAEATFRQAEDAYKRVLPLRDKGTVTEVQFIDIETKYMQAKNTLEGSTATYNDLTIRAPYDCVVEKVQVAQGETVSMSSAMFVLSDVVAPEIQFSVPEGEIRYVHPGDSVSVEIPALDYLTVPARVTVKGASSDRISHSFQCVCMPTVKVPDLLPGMVCSVNFIPTDINPAITVPPAAVRSDSDGFYIWTVRDSRVEKTRIVPGGFSSRGVIILSGLQDGDRIVSEGVYKVSSGLKVNPVEENGQNE